MKTRPTHLLPLLFAALVLLGPGCRSIKLFPELRDKSNEEKISDLRPTPPTTSLPGKFSLRLSPYVFLSDFELKRDQPELRDLAQLRDQVLKELKLPPSDRTVQVYLFEDRERYERFLKEKYPDLPPRRAFFIAQPRKMGGAEDLIVYTWWSKSIQQDLRHELTHALLHSVLKDVPLWLDEGLAEYFELPPERQNINEQHLAHFRQSDLTPDLARLERMTQVKDMTPAEYREAWAWVHLLLKGPPQVKAVLLTYLQQLRTTPAVGSLRQRLVTVLPDPETALTRHVRQVEALTRRGR